MEVEIEELPKSYRVGPVLYLTDPLKLALIQEAQAWKRAYARHLNAKCGQQMDEILDFTENLMKRLSRPVKVDVWFVY